MKKYNIFGVFGCVLLLALFCSVSALAADAKPVIQLSETDMEHQYKVQIQNWDSKSYSVQFDVSVSNKVSGEMNWSEAAASSYRKMTTEEKNGTTTFTFYLDCLSPISDSGNADFGILTLKAENSNYDFSTSGKLKTLDEKLRETHTEGMEINVSRKTSPPEPDTEEPEPDTEQPKPDTEQPQPDTEQPQPDTKPQKPDEKESGAPVVPVTPDPVKLSLNKSSITLYLRGTGRTATLSAAVDGRKVSGSSVKWKVDNPKYVSVKNGKITAKRAGLTYVTVIKNGSKSICRVKVKTASVSLSKRKVTLYLGGRRTLILKATVNGRKVSGSKVKWRTSNSSIALVKKGKIRVRRAGTVKITAEANGKKAVCTLRVKKSRLTPNKSS